MTKRQSVNSQSSDEISVEVNSDSSYFSLNQIGIQDDSFLDIFPYGNEVLADDNIHGYCESSDLFDSIAHYDQSNDFDKYVSTSIASSVEINSGPSSVYDLISGFSFDPDSDLFAVDNDKDFFNDDVNNSKANQEPILLSFSVGVGVPQRVIPASKKIEIVYDLEETFRPRYKSDYYAQNGKIRKPRYVADRYGNHYITLKISPGICGKIRIDWLTVPTENGERYMMPYQFQNSHESSELKDCNPLHLNIKTDSAGIMKLYLVLIKAKQDALKSLQPLQPFRPVHEIFGVENKNATEKWLKLTPKQLIKQYQLGKSQLAFTLCTANADGKTYITEWDTTVFSTVLTEDGADASTVKSVACPNCACEIHISEDTTANSGTATIKRKKIQTSDAEPVKAKKKKENV